MNSTSLRIGGIVFPDMDQADLTGPFEVLSRLPDSEFLVVGRFTSPIRDVRGLVLTPQVSFIQTPPLDVLIVPGGAGTNKMMEDEVTLSFIRQQAAGARLILSVCTGALILGAAGLLQGRRATTHWSAHSLLPSFGAIPVDERVVVDGNLVSAAGVTSGIDGALKVAAILCGDAVAQGIQLYMEYSPAPPFDSGSPATAPREVLATMRENMKATMAERQAIAARVAKNLGISS